MSNKIVGRLWNNADIEIAQIDGEMYALYGWNGEEWLDCWKVGSTDGLEDSDDKHSYTVKPVYEAVDEEETQFDIVDFRVQRT